MAYTVEQIAVALGAKALGATGLLIEGLAEPAGAGPDDLALAMKPGYAAGLAEGKARAAMLWEGADWQALGLEAAIIAPRPRFAMAELTRSFDPGESYGAGIHPSAVIHETAEIAEDVQIGPFVVIGPRARIGAGSVIGPQCFIGADAVLGQGAFLREAVSIGARCTIGDRLIAQPGARVGGDGFSFVTAEVSGVEAARASLGDQGETKSQSWTRIHSVGAVTIGDDVELGMNCTIDRGTIRNTRIGNRTKLDNQVHLGHNVQVGDDCLLCGQVGVAGSTRIGNNVVLGGQVGVNDNISIGDNVICGGATKVFTKIPAGRVMLGYPAVKMETHVEMYKSLRRLPRLLADVAAMKKQVSKRDATD
ncbi:UDP-3-O-(3-hydroxymyristoyl)glucosamine N-acyltransferase [Shimia biformata]|uniref:UDP-3-O-(3-hydroxymyristoyl)glucosamine N-acyltransferase n=1 Tax=Shimia biformata TaxID=1294299 RepID=UPI0019523713|nr:UDP-3-O-(3-hydroxymyristoyl)glucosamine N-acyltransferase [Shimia biformata]